MNLPSNVTFNFVLYKYTYTNFIKLVSSRKYTVQNLEPN